MLRLNCIKFNFGWGSAPDPTGGAHSATRTSKLDSRRSTSNGSEWKGRGGQDLRKERREKEEGGMGEEGKGRGREEINLPHGRLKTLTALENITRKAKVRRCHQSYSVQVFEQCTTHCVSLSSNNSSTERSTVRFLHCSFYQALNGLSLCKPLPH